MNPTLAALYNTNGYAESYRRQQVKIAHLEKFAQAAAAQGIDLSALDDATRTALYTEFTQKLAEEGAEVPEDEEGEGEGEGEGEEESEGEGEGDEEEKEAQAQFLALREYQSKIAEADMVGRVMAHAFHNERVKIAEGETQATLKERIGNAVSGAAGRVGQAAGRVGQHVMANKGRYAVGAGAAGLAAGGGLLAAKMMRDKKSGQEGEKEASAFDIQAARHAVKLAQAASFDGNEAARRLTSVLTLGAPDMDKTAHALGSYADAINVRALELLEAARYPVDWSQVFG